MWLDESTITALIGASVVLIRPLDTSKVKLVRMFLSGFFLSYFAWRDAVNLVQHIFSFTVSEGAVIFFIAYTGATILERCLVILNAITITPDWNKKP
jgi:hypothetical protein